MSKLDSIIVTGDLILLDPAERIQFYVQTCESMCLNPLTRPLQYFEQIDRNGKRNLILYALRNASAQLRATRGLSVKLLPAEFLGDAVLFTAIVTNPKGETDSAVGAESLKGFEGKEYADRIMAAQTKAKRRAILDFVGAALLDESEVEGMRGSVVEVTNADLSGYVAIPAAPAPAAPSAPATEVVAEPKVFKIPDSPDTRHATALKPEREYASNIDPKVIDKIIEQAAKDLGIAAGRPDPLAVWPVGVNLDVVVEGPSIDPKITEAADSLVQNMINKMHGDVTAATGAIPAVVTMELITARLNAYRRDTLQRGGMRPSKGFGIAAKWEKFLRKHAPDKTIEQYQTLLTALDLLLQQSGEVGVVAKIEQEIL